MHADQLADLVPRGDAAGDRAAIGRLVIARARRRESHGAGRERVRPASRFIAARSSASAGSENARSPIA